MYYQLWETASGNLVDEFDSERDAFASVRAFLAPPDEGGRFVLLCYRGEGDLAWKLEGEELAHRAAATAA